MIDYIYSNKKEIEVAYRVAMELCNFKCPYCNPYGERFFNKTKLLKYLKNHQQNINYNIGKLIDVIYNEYGFKTKLLLKGGEPCILPLEYWENLKNNLLNYQNISKIIFYTNFSESLEYFLKIYNIYGDKIVFECAWHDVNPESIDQFINKAYELKNKNINVNIHFTVNDNNFIGEEICEKIKKLNIPLKFTKIIDKQNKFNNITIKNKYLLNYFDNDDKKTKLNYTISNNGIKSEISLQDIKDMSFKDQNLICLGRISIKLLNINKKISSIVLSPFSSCDFKKKNNYNIIINNRNYLNIAIQKLDYQILKDYLKKFEYKCEKEYKQCSNINCRPFYIYNINYNDKINE